MKRLRVVVYLLLILFMVPTIADAQGPPVKSERRMNIDQKRMVNDMFGKDALNRSREFIRIDSTYYVGWMYEGTYKYNHAADMLGYKNATVPLAKALRLLSRDYTAQLKTRTNDFIAYYFSYQFQMDYTLIASMLWDCYNNINEPEMAFELIGEVKKWRFRRDYYFSVYSNYSWVVHRNRYYTQSKYYFLKNSVEENEALANRYLDSGLVNIKKNVRLNTGIFYEGYEESEKQSIYHYKAILHNYQMNIDSAQYYYDLMKGKYTFSYNNYAIFQFVIGKFQESYFNFEIASRQDPGDKRLLEWAYFGSILDIYRNNTHKAMTEMDDLIKAVGSTPGYGWYNIALARAESYAGRLDQSEKHAAKALGFKEVNIGTTLGDGQYAFSANLINLVNDVLRIKEQKFEHKNWWYNVLKWPKMASLAIKKYLQQYLLVNQLALNPEREDVIYPLFSSENTVSFDEVWYLIQNFSTSFFYKKYKERFDTDTRPLVKKYYLLFLAKLEMEQGKYKDAKDKLTSILSDPGLDTDYEKLFLARTYEALSICNSKLKNKDDEMLYAYHLYLEYPQLLPYSDVKMKFRLVLEDRDAEVISKLKKFRIDWTDKTETYTPTLKIDFYEAENNKKSVRFSVLNGLGEEIIPEQGYVYDDAKDAANYIAYAIFGINKSDNFNQEER